MRTPLATPLILCVAITIPRLWAAEPEPNAKTTAYQTSVSQEQLRGNARRLKQEMAELFAEFGEYRSAAGELQRLKLTTDELDGTSMTEMVAVVKTLREASRMENSDVARGKIVEASTEQKNIQAVLRKLADRLILQKDAAAMQQRVKNLALRQVANLRTAKELEASGAKPEKVPWEMKERQLITKTEQEALREEVKMAMDTLKKLAENTEAPKNEIFKEALAKAEQQGLKQKSEEAAEKTKTDFAAAAQKAKEVSDALQNVLEELAKNESAAEKSNALAQELKELAQQEDRMANATSRASSAYQNAMRKEQNQISAKLEVAQKAIEKLNADAAAQTAQAAEKSEQLADSLKKGAKLDKVEGVAKTADAQREIAQQLKAAGEMLQKQADALAANDPANNANSPEGAPQSPAEAAVGEAVKQVLEAKSQMSIAKNQLAAGAADAGKQRLADAQNALEKAAEKAAEAGVDKAVGEQLQKAEANAANVAKAAGEGTKEEQAKSLFGLDRAQENASKALEGLKQAANQMAAKASADAAAKMAQGDQPGKPGEGKPGEGKDGPPGPPKEGKGAAKFTGKPDNKAGGSASGDTKAESTDFSALAKLQAGQREAISLLKTEKAPSEYEAMVQQYLRNLAEAESNAP